MKWRREGRCYRTLSIMKRLCLFLACLALCVPITAVHWPATAQETALPGGVLSLDPMAQDPFRVLEDARRGEIWGQVRVERRVIIRIAPSDEATRTTLMAELPRREMQTNFEEVPHTDCVQVESILGVRPTRDNRLLLFTRDRAILTATLERNCSARDFYSGFYVERSEDGRLCADRDRLQSRAGSSCAVEGFNRLVAVAG